MYKIGEFSKITGLTVKALRYYDQQELLTPSIRCENGYRYYDEQDFEKALFIRQLRTLEFSISEIRDIIMVCESQQDFNCILRQKQKMIRQQIVKEQELIKRLEEYLTPESGAVQAVDYEITIKEVKPVQVAFIRFKGTYRDLDQYVPKLYQAVKDGKDGAHFNIYYDMEYTKHADIQLCLPVKSSFMDSQRQVKYQQLGSITALSTIHTGSYETLTYAYKALMDYAALHGCQLCTPSREIYRKGPGMVFRGNPNRYVTEIQMPIEGGTI